MPDAPATAAPSLVNFALTDLAPFTLEKALPDCDIHHLLLIVAGYWLGAAKHGINQDATGKPGDPVNIAPAPELVNA